MSAAIAIEIFELQSLLDEVIDWVEKNKLGMSKEDAKRIFHRYRTTREKPQGEQPPSETPTPPTEELRNTAERQAKQITQILDYMEQNTQRLGKIENDIDYIKERVDSILKRL